MARRTTQGTAWLVGVLSVASLTGTPGVASACDNDRDSRRMERNHFPEVEAVLSGGYLRHSPAWFEWRIRDRRERLARVLDPEAVPDGGTGLALSAAAFAALDDLGVAYDKLGRTDDAIATGRRALAHDPDRYESLMNLGTYLCHAGKADEGLPLLRRAVEVNPGAHFGRAELQIAAVEYVEARRRDGVVELPLARREGDGEEPVGFAAFLARREARDAKRGAVMPLSTERLAHARTGVTGLLFSTRPDDPVLLELLAHLFVDPDQAWRADADARTLAAKTYLRAALAVPSPTVAAAYRREAAGALDVEGDATRIPRGRLDALEGSLLDAIAAADTTSAKVRADEESLLATALDPEAAFDAAYGAGSRPYAAPSRQVPGDRPDGRRAAPRASPTEPPLGAIAAGLLAAAGLLGYVTRRRPLPRRPARKLRLARIP